MRRKKQTHKLYRYSLSFHSNSGDKLAQYHTGNAEKAYFVGTLDIVPWKTPGQSRSSSNAVSKGLISPVLAWDVHSAVLPCETRDYIFLAL